MMITEFSGGDIGPWEVIRMETVIGKPIEKVSRIEIKTFSALSEDIAPWRLRGFASNVRYAKKVEEEKLAVLHQSLGRPQATYAALIPIRKSDAWWVMAQDERRSVFEEQSRHTEIGLQYLPAIARKLYHCRDIGEPFDFLTWFEYSPSDSHAFEELVSRLRQSEEWKFVNREIDIRLKRIGQ